MEFQSVVSFSFSNLSIKNKRVEQNVLILLASGNGIISILQEYFSEIKKFFVLCDE